MTTLDTRSQVIAAATAAMEGDRFGPATDGLHANLRWLVDLRWLAVGGLTVSLIAAKLTDWVPRLAPAFLTAAALALGNLGLWLWLHRGRTRGRTSVLRTITVLQLLGDLIALSLILRWTGGLLNPFAMFLVFPVTLGAMLLHGRLALVCCTSAFLLFGGMVACELSSSNVALPLHRDGADQLGFVEHPVFLVALLTAAALTMFGVVYFVHSVAHRQRIAEIHQRQHRRIAQSRGRLARVGMIAAGVAHSVRNPLHGVMNCLDLVRDAERREEVEPVLELMQEGLTRIEKVTTRLLALSRDTPMAPTPTAVADLLRETLGLLEVRIRNRSIELELDLAPVPKIRLDPLRMQEALFNILDNAVAAVDGRPGARIRVRLRPVMSPVDGVAIEVSDSGPGVAPEVVEHVFDPFFSTKPVGEGTGLGLAIAKEVVEAHDGVIRFESSPKNGTTVSILLPQDASGGLE